MRNIAFEDYAYFQAHNFKMLMKINNYIEVIRNDSSIKSEKFYKIDIDKKHCIVYKLMNKDTVCIISFRENYNENILI